MSTQNGHPSTDGLAIRAWALLREWSLTEGLTWVYIAKAVAAGLIAMFIAMRLELPSPRTALTTVFVVMTPQSGMVLAKSFYRLIGTTVGLIAMVTFISLFSQAHLLYLVATAVWIALCTAGSARNRNFRSYGFVLAGYTAALIGVSNAEAPLGAFDAAITRVIEVSLGIICSALVSAIVFPRYSSSLLETQIRSRFSGFVDFIRAASLGRLDRAAWEQRQVGFIADVVGLEALRSYSIFEDPLSRLRSARLTRLNSESMAASTRFHALHQLLLRAQANYIAPHHAYAGGPVEPSETNSPERRDGAKQDPQNDLTLSPVVRAITPLLHELAEHLSVGGRPVAQAADAERVALQLAAFQATLRDGTHGNGGSTEEDIDTAVELLDRFCDDLQHYARTYASLAQRTRPAEALSPRETDPRAYIPKTNALMATLAGARAGITLLLVSAFWIYSGWPSGDFATLTAGTICALISASPQPARAAVQMVGGSILACTAGYIMTFIVLPHQDGYVLLAASMAPFLMFGAWLTTRRKWIPAGLAYCIFFCFLSGPDNLSVYDPVTYLNNSVALVVAMGISACAFGVFLPPTTSWLVRRVARDLRGLIRVAAFPRRNRHVQRSHQLDHQTRDLMFQIAGLTAENPPLQRAMLQWMFSVLEIGHALIEVLSVVEHYANARHPWLDSARNLREPLSGLFDHPSRERWTAALGATNHAIDMTRARRAQDDGTIDADEHAHLLRMQRYLHFIRTALLDEASPLAAYHAPTTRSPKAQNAQETSS